MVGGGNQNLSRKRKQAEEAVAEMDGDDEMMYKPSR